MPRVFNFAPGPANLPQSVLERARDELLNWDGSGMSVMEVSHRGKAFMAVAQRAEQDLRELLAIPENYRVLFLQGGATGQFAGIPMNLTQAEDTADYINTGQWSKKAIAEAGKYCTVHVAADAGGKYTRVPRASELRFSDAAAYAHYTPNETIGGVEFDYIPVTRAPLVGDFSSTLLSRPLDVSRFGLIYAGAQKNIGPAGLVVVIVRDDLLGRARADTPSIFNYATQAADHSMSNTPPTLSWYLAGLVLQWIKQQGGLDAMAKLNREKARRLYAAIDESSFYANPVEKNSRSWMNVPFTLADPQREKDFAAQAARAGLKNLEGHRSVGGMRASIYNAMPLAGVDALIEFMREFERTAA